MMRHRRDEVSIRKPDEWWGRAQQHKGDRIVGRQIGQAVELFSRIMAFSATDFAESNSDQPHLI
jgi:hypothetical protein